MDEAIRGTTRLERVVRVGEVCPGCLEPLHVEEMGTFAAGRMLVYIKCQCRRWRVKHIVFEPRISPEPDEFDGLTNVAVEEKDKPDEL